MFNALNRFISRLDGDAPQSKENHGAFGFQVLRNTNLDLAVEPWFDFVIGINGRMIDDSDPRLFAQEVRNCAGGSVMLGLWSAKGQRTRALHIPVPPDSASLGLALQWTPLAVVSNIWHVLDVPANSPADVAGLLPYSDYILGTPDGILHGEGGLSELVEDHIGRPLRLYVYNNEYNVTREVTIQPSRDWGGEGALGCVLGYGALHRLPAPLSEPVQGPGETLFDGDTAANGEGYSSQFMPSGNSGLPQSNNNNDNRFSPAPTGSSSSADFLIPAQAVGTPPPPSGPPRSKKKERHHHHGQNHLMDDYFKEQEEKSKELDNVPSGRASPLPPPPKAGAGPPRGGPPRAGAGENTATPPPPPKADAADGNANED
ncbi:GRASP55/65 PDZ-like domain-containing protein [Apodospora peruviana]|uniref:GRASP55/65 PDZ-like domain-containing protein n=1 Tax=Apodospora peruviana TaxID=516989 RepID=A0AAE0IRB5_9PEZI|nr:GRASP55/65 PDZ-like domain-containing protein [Apodospora peruviana]